MGGDLRGLDEFGGLPQSDFADSGPTIGNQFPEKEISASLVVMVDHISDPLSEDK